MIMLQGLLKGYFRKKAKEREPIYVEDLIWQREVYPYYCITQNNFKYCMHNGLLSRQEILSFKDKLSSCIKNKRKYNGIKWKNDAHTIYTLLKDTSISKKQMLKLNEELQPYIEFANQNEVYKKVQHLAIVK